MLSDSIIILISNLHIKLSDGLFQYLTLNAAQENVFIFSFLFIFIYIYLFSKQQLVIENYFVVTGKQTCS